LAYLGLKHLDEAVEDAVVPGLAEPGLDLQSRLDDVGRGGGRRGGDAGQRTGQQEVGVGEAALLVPERLLELGVGREVDAREGDIAQEARRRSPIEACGAKKKRKELVTNQ
jgi:hypothetical protein